MIKAFIATFNVPLFYSSFCISTCMGNYVWGFTCLKLFFESIDFMQNTGSRENK